MAIKIDKPIIDARVLTEEKPKEEVIEPKLRKVDIKRAKTLTGTTTKIKTNESNMYITLNNIEIEGKIHVHEIFINSQHQGSHQYISFISRLISAVFRASRDPSFIVREAKSIFAEEGYWEQGGGGFHPSVIHHIGCVIGDHLEHLKVINSGEKVPEKAPMEQETPKEESIKEAKKPRGSLCPECGEYSVVKTDGCAGCICGYSHCS
jgi:ribonucleoside-diphosphate reductase alpha chain